MAKEKHRFDFNTVSTYVLALAAFGAAAITATALVLDSEHSGWAYWAALVAAVATLATAINQHRREQAIDVLTKELGAKSDELMRVTESVRSSITGGDSFAALYFPERNGSHWMTIRHFGEYALKDIRISVGTISPNLQLRPLDSLVYPSLFPKGIELIKPIRFNVGSRFGFQVTFEATNRTWMETVKTETIDGRLVFALQVWVLEPEAVGGVGVMKILHTDIDDDFPRQPDGNVDWSLAVIQHSPLQATQTTVSPVTVEDMVRRQLGMKREPRSATGIHDLGPDRPSP